jgi:hypothetical protein
MAGYGPDPMKIGFRIKSEYPKFSVARSARREDLRLPSINMDGISHPEELDHDCHRT